MVGCKITLKKMKSEWLSTLLHSKFFESCSDHRELRKNEKNVFCIDCNLCFCRHCLDSSVHCLHRRLQICRYVYHDVIRLQDIQKHLDCSKIQTYKINGEKAVHLNPRPQSKDTKSSKSKNGAFCEACGRHIQDFPNKFCSIACKASTAVEISREKRHRLIPIPIHEFEDLHLKENYDTEENTSEKESSISVAESSEEYQAWLSSTLKPKKKQAHKRKGVPHRAPLH